MAAPGAPSKTRLQVTTPESHVRAAATGSPDTDRTARLHPPAPKNGEWTVPDAAGMPP